MSTFSMYPFGSPSGIGMTPNKELAEEMIKLRDLYIVACKTGNEPEQKRILEEEKKLTLRIEHDGQQRNMTTMQGLIPKPPDHPPSPRFMRITAYVSRERDTGRRSAETFLVDWTVYLDTYEIEAACHPTQGGWQLAQIHMKSGKVWEVSDTDIERIEQALRERNKP